MTTHDIRSMTQDIRTTCLKCGKPTEISCFYCPECKKLMRKRRKLPWYARTSLWIAFISLVVVLFLAAENTVWMQQILRGLGW